MWQRQSVALQVNAAKLAIGFLEVNAPSLPCVWDERVATTERCPPAEYREACYRLFWRATLRRCHGVWDECVATTERCPPGEYLEACSGFFGGQRSVVAIVCGTSVWQRQSVALQVNASELTPGCLTVLVIAPCCLMLLTRGSAFSF